MQAAAPFANVPTGHVSAVNAQEEAPAALYAPAAHGRHAALDELGLYAPAAQAAQEAAAAPLKVPAGQAVGAAEPTGQNAPGGQTSHAKLEEAPMA